ncbi:MAG: Histidine kinase [Frankiales bacterium]|jgi:signal transduction histidine kinase|nr:Histidine kinase [Frankiales bacterium]
MSPREQLRSARAAWLPQGRALSERDFAWRHRVVCLILALHLPVLLVVGTFSDDPLLHGLGKAGAVLALLLLALAPVHRRVASLAATFGLLLCSALLAHLFDGSTEVHFHYFVAVALIALYQDWVTYVAAVAFVGLQHGLVGTFDAGAVGLEDGPPWRLALVHAGFILAESSVLVLFWHANEQARDGQEQLQVALWEGQRSVRARLEETDRIRNDLIGTVSHEFRTPLTGIRAAALTLLKRSDRLDRTARETLLHGMLDQQERLSRLLENMLTASQATTADPTAVTDVHAVAAEVAMLAGAARPETPGVSVIVEPGTLARIDRQALHQVLANLIDNAQVHGAPHSTPLVTGGRDSRGTWVAVSNDGSTMDQASARRLFEPFAQADSGPTRLHEGLGMGLYVVRRLVEVHGGEVDVRSEDGWVTVEVHLQSADAVADSPSEALAS